MARNLTAVLKMSAFTAMALCCFGAAVSHVALSYPTPVDFNGKLLRWNIKKGDPALTYEIIADDEAVREEFSSAIDDSVALWNGVETSYVRMTPVLEGQSAQISIHLKSAIEGGDFSAGYSTFDVYSAKGPTHCEIYIAVDATTAYVPFSKTALHEIGHCLGLGHSLIAEAIMSYELDKNRFELDIDDRAVVSRLYPADGSKPKLPPGCAVAGGLGAGRIWILFLLPLIYAFATRSAPGSNARNSARTRESEKLPGRIYKRICKRITSHVSGTLTGILR